MATVIQSISTSERLKKGKHLIPSLLELQMIDIARFGPYEFEGDLFPGGAAPGIFQSTASGAASAAAAISTGVVNGAILLDAGTADDGRSDLSLGLHLQGQLNAHVWWRFSMSAVTAAKFEVGFTDVVSGTDAGAVNSKASNTFTATDAVVLCLDTDDDALLTLMGTKNGTPDTVIDVSADVLTLAAATYYYMGIELRDDQARAHLLNANGKWIHSTAWMDDAVTETVLLTPWAFVQNRSATQRTMTIDWLFAYQRRTDV